MCENNKEKKKVEMGAIESHEEADFKSSEFPKLQKSVRNLFEVHKRTGEYYNYVHDVVHIKRDKRPNALEEHQTLISYATANILDSFYVWYKIKINNLFRELETHLSTGDLTIDSSRKEKRDEIEKMSKYIKFRRELALCVYNGVYEWIKENEWEQNYIENACAPEGRYIILKIITDYIFNLFDIKKTEKV